MHHPKTARIRSRLNLPTLSSEDKFHAQLNVARVVPLRRHQSKCCGIARIQADAVAKVGVIKSIDGFGAKLQLRVFSEPKVLRDRQVHVQEGLVEGHDAIGVCVREEVLDQGDRRQRPTPRTTSRVDGGRAPPL